MTIVFFTSQPDIEATFIFIFFIYEYKYIELLVGNDIYIASIYFILLVANLLSLMHLLA